MTGIEPVTFALAARRSTPELHSHERRMGPTGLRRGGGSNSQGVNSSDFESGAVASYRLASPGNDRSERNGRESNPRWSTSPPPSKREPCLSATIPAISTRRKVRESNPPTTDRRAIAGRCLTTRPTFQSSNSDAIATGSVRSSYSNRLRRPRSNNPNPRRRQRWHARGTAACSQERSQCGFPT